MTEKSLGEDQEKSKTNTEDADTSIDSFLELGSQLATILRAHGVDAPLSVHDATKRLIRAGFRLVEPPDLSLCRGNAATKGCGEMAILSQGVCIKCVRTSRELAFDPSRSNPKEVAPDLLVSKEIARSEEAPAVFDTPYTFDPNRGLPRPPEGFVRDAVASEEPQELTEALDALEGATWSAGWTHSIDRTARDAARSAIKSLFRRQREEMPSMRPYVGLADEEAPDSKRRPRPSRRNCAEEKCGWYKTTVALRAQVADLLAQLEQFKANLLTLEEATALTEMAHWRGFAHPPKALHLPEGTLEKLRAISALPKQEGS